jgi:hypothetical protein
MHASTMWYFSYYAWCWSIVQYAISETLWTKKTIVVASFLVPYGAQPSSTKLSRSMLLKLNPSFSHYRYMVRLSQGCCCCQEIGSCLSLCTCSINMYVLLCRPVFAVHHHVLFLFFQVNECIKPPLCVAIHNNSVGGGGCAPSPSDLIIIDLGFHHFRRMG